MTGTRIFFSRRLGMDVGIALTRAHAVAGRMISTHFEGVPFFYLDEDNWAVLGTVFTEELRKVAMFKSFFGSPPIQESKEAVLPRDTSSPAKAELKTTAPRKNQLSLYGT